MKTNIRMDGERKNIFEILALLDWEPDQRLMDLEEKLMNGYFDQKRKRTKRYVEPKFTKAELKKLCAQQIPWGQIAEKLGESVIRVRDYAQRNGITNHISVGRPKIIDAQEKMASRIRYYDRISPSEEKIDQLMILYGGFIGLLAFKLNKPFRIARNVLIHRKRYDAWLKYNYYLGRGGRPKTLEEIRAKQNDQ
jgi:hypothetical protein